MENNNKKIDKTNEIVKNLIESGNEIITNLAKEGSDMLLFYNLSDKKYGIYNFKEKSIKQMGESLRGLKNAVSQIMGQTISMTEFEVAVEYAINIEQVTSNPFIKGSLIQATRFDKIHGHYRLNEVKLSEYHDKLKPVRGGKNTDILLKSIRMNEEIYFNYSFTEILLAWTMYHSTKITTILGLYSGDRGVGKTLLVTLAQYLYEEENNPISLIDSSDTNASSWGDYKKDKRSVIYDDLPNIPEIVERLGAMMKKDATYMGVYNANMKGGKVTPTNSFTSLFTTNSRAVMAMILDGSRDRRLHFAEVKAEDFSQEDILAIEDMDIPVSGDRSKYFPIIQELLNHFYFIYQETKDDKEIRRALMKYAPVTKLKAKFVTRNLNTHKAFIAIADTATSLSELVTRLTDEFGGTKDFSFLNNPENTYIGKVRNRYYLHLDSTNLRLLGVAISGRNNITDGETFMKYFKKDYDYKRQRYGGGANTKKCIRFAMKNYKTN
jgi:hypothetical protein